MRLAILAAGLFAAAFSAAPAWAAPDTVIAKVNGHDITEQQLTFAESDAFASDLAGMPPERRRRVLVDFLVEMQLLADAAEKEKLAEGNDFEARMQYYRLRALRDVYFKKHIEDATVEGEAKKIYDEKVKSLPGEEEVHARHILLKTEEEAKKVAEELKTGKDFAELATKYSQDRGGEAGGDLGYFTRGQMVEQFQDAAFALEKGKISEPVQTEFGWHIIKLEDKRSRLPPTFDEVKDQIMISIVNTKVQSMIETMHASSKVEIVDADLKKAIEAEQAEAEKAVADPKAGEEGAAKPDAGK